MLSKDNFCGLMAGVASMFNANLTEFVLDTYYEIFKRYSDEQFKDAITKTVKTHRYNTLPKPADILYWLEDTPSDKALMAWLKVKEAIIRAGYYRSVEFDDPIISNCIVELGGWMSLCSSLTEDMPFIEKRFKDLYNLYHKREVKTPIKLIGFLELKNSEKGYFVNIPKPLRIGSDCRKSLELVTQQER